ncbi:MAG: DUF3305 domain-containing protein [Gemmobacter sp.]
MPRETLRLGVVARSHPPATVWGGRVLRPVAVLPVPAPLAAGTVMSDIEGVQTVYLGDHALMLHHGETAHYLMNLGAARPSVWVSLDGARVHLVTPDPFEGEALAGDPERVVEAVAMPPEVCAAVAAFVAAHHAPEPFEKRKRKPASITEADPRAPRILAPGQKWGAR